MFSRMFILALIAIGFSPASKADPLLIDGKPSRKEPLAVLKQPDVLKGSVQKKALKPDLTNPKVLDGKVIKGVLDNQVFRLPRPGVETSAAPLNGLIKGSEKPFAPFDGKASILTPRTDDGKSLTGGTSNSSAQGSTTAESAPIQNSAGRSDPDAGDKSTPRKKCVIVRIRRVIAFLEGEIAESAIRMALLMLKKEPNSNVTIMLDLDAVSLADGEFNFYDQGSTGEDGNLRAVSIKNLRTMLTNFGYAGGRILVSEHWVKVRGFRTHTNTMVPNIQLLDDEAMAEALLEATNVIDY